MVQSADGFVCGIERQVSTRIVSRRIGVGVGEQKVVEVEVNSFWDGFLSYGDSEAGGLW